MLPSPDMQHVGNLKLCLASVKFGVCLAANKLCLEAGEPFFLTSLETGCSLHSPLHTLFSVTRGRDLLTAVFIWCCRFVPTAVSFVCSACVTMGEGEVCTWGNWRLSKWRKPDEGCTQTRLLWLNFPESQNDAERFLVTFSEFSRVVSNRAKRAFWKQGYQLRVLGRL